MWSLDLRVWILEWGRCTARLRLGFLLPERLKPKAAVEASLCGSTLKDCRSLPRFVIVTSKTPFNSALKFREA
jgi:hypothetical protein